jgi:hypothetical protein
MDNRCDNEKKKNYRVGAKSCVTEDPRIQKMPVINPLQALVHLQIKKKTILHVLLIPNPNFSEFAFSVNTSAD